MNLAGKVLVVLNLILSVAFAVASLSLYAKKVNMVEEANTYIARYNDAQEKLNRRDVELADVKAEFESTKKETDTAINNYKRDLAKAESRVNRLEGDNQQFTSTFSQIETKIGSLSAELQNALARNDDLNSELEKVRDELLAAKQDRNFYQDTALEATADLKETESELMAMSKRNASLMEQVIEQRTMLDRIRTQNPDLLRASTATPVQRVSGKIIKVQEPVDLVIVNVGENDNLKVGMELVVSRGSDYIGKVKIRTLYENMASAVIDREMTVKPVRVGDAAETM